MHWHLTQLFKSNLEPSINSTRSVGSTIDDDWWQYFAVGVFNQCLLNTNQRTSAGSRRALYCVPACPSPPLDNMLITRHKADVDWWLDRHDWYMANLWRNFPLWEVCLAKRWHYWVLANGLSQYRHLPFNTPLLPGGDYRHPSEVWLNEGETISPTPSYASTLLQYPSRIYGK